jgi:hypothetical protein
MNQVKIDQLKTNIYSQIDKLNDETALLMLQETVLAYSSPLQKDIIDELSPEQEKRLHHSVLQANEGRTVSNEEVNQKAKQWLSK